MLNVAPENAPTRNGRIDVVFDPRKLATVMSAFELRKPGWKTTDMLLCSVAAIIAIFYTVALLLWL